MIDSRKCMHGFWLDERCWECDENDRVTEVLAARAEERERFFKILDEQTLMHTKVWSEDFDRWLAGVKGEVLGIDERRKTKNEGVK